MSPDPGKFSPYDHLVDEIFPRNEVHLIGGTSDAGKTRFLFRWLLDWSAGQPFFGHQSHPCPFVYVAADRTLRSAVRTLEAMGIDPCAIPTIPAFGTDNKNMRQIIDTATEMKAEFVVIEAFQRFVDGRQGAKEVHEFLSRMSCYTEPCKERPNGLTVLGVCESPKLKPNERYQDARQRVSGVSAWGYFGSTVMLIERQDPTDPQNEYRTLYVCPKIGQRIQAPGEFDQHGHLIFQPGPIIPKPLPFFPKPSKTTH